MTGQTLMYAALLSVLLVDLSAGQATAVEPGACDADHLDCADCLALAPNCTWFVCEQDATESRCGSVPAGAAEGCHPLEDAVCPAPATDAPATSTTVFSTTVDPEPTTPTEPPTEPPTTTETPTTTTDTTPATTETPTETPSTTEIPTTTGPTPTDLPTTTPGTPTVPTTTVPSTADPGPAPGPAPTPAPRSGGFSFGSFVGGILLCLVVMAGAFVGLKVYRRRQAMTGRYNNL